MRENVAERDRLVLSRVREALFWPAHIGEEIRLSSRA